MLAQNLGRPRVPRRRRVTEFWVSHPHAWLTSWARRASRHEPGRGRPSPPRALPGLGCRRFAGGSLNRLLPEAQVPRRRLLGQSEVAPLEAAGVDHELLEDVGSTIQKLRTWTARRGDRVRRRREVHVVRRLFRSHCLFIFMSLGAGRRS